MNLGTGQTNVFLKIKEALTSTDVLSHFDPKLPLGVACDASSVGVGAVLFHKYSDGSERPIAYASKSLTSAEKNCSQIEHKALSIIFSVRKFHQFLYGRQFLLLTNHKLLFLDTKRVFPQWLLADFSSGRSYYHYTYTISYKRTKEHGNADCLSRLLLVTDPEFEKFHTCESMVNLIQETQIKSLPLSADIIKKEIEKDTVLSHVLHKIKNGWPNTTKSLPKELHPFFPVSYS